MKNKYKLLKVLLVLLALVVAGVIYSLVTNNGGELSESSVSLASSGSSEENITNKQVSDQASIVMGEDSDESGEETLEAILVCVHVCGAVNNPGVYYLNEGARVHEAVKMAGGTSEAAAEDYINLAKVISDGEKIYIPTLEEIANGDITLQDEENASAGNDDLININSAGKAELMTLTGIGEGKAEAIITYRENVSSFKKIEDIKNVSGIKDSVFEKIKDHIKV